MMTPEQIYEAIEPSKLRGLTMDIALRRVALDLVVVNGGTERAHSLSFEGVSSVSLKRPPTADWNYVELSEIVIEPSNELQDHLRFWAELWTDASLEIHAERVLFDDSEVRAASGLTSA